MSFASLRRLGLLLMGLVVVPGVSVAQGPGVISQVEVTASTSASFKVYLAPPVTTICAGSTLNWAYINSGDPNYSAVVATLLAAKAQALNVTIIATADSGTNYCHISTVQVS